MKCFVYKFIKFKYFNSKISRRNFLNSTIWKSYKKILSLLSLDRSELGKISKSFRCNIYSLNISDNESLIKSFYYSEPDVDFQLYQKSSFFLKNESCINQTNFPRIHWTLQFYEHFVYISCRRWIKHQKFQIEIP